MKNHTRNSFSMLYKNMTFIFLLKELFFINLFFLGPKGCKLMKIHTSFRIRGKERIFLHPLLAEKFIPSFSNFSLVQMTTRNVKYPAK